jgi:hypothetical protein
MIDAAKVEMLHFLELASLTVSRDVNFVLVAHISR